MSWSLIKTIYSAHSGSIWQLETIDRNSLASVSNDRTIHIWNMNNWSLKKSVYGHADAIMDIKNVDSLIEGIYFFEFFCCFC